MMAYSRRPAKYGQPKKYGTGFIYGSTRTEYGGFASIRRSESGLVPPSVHGGLLAPRGEKA